MMSTLNSDSDFKIYLEELFPETMFSIFDMIDHSNTSSFWIALSSLPKVRFEVR